MSNTVFRGRGQPRKRRAGSLRATRSPSVRECSLPLAVHERCYARHKKVLELEHYLDVLVKKPGALAGSTALEQCAQGLRQRQGKQAGTRAMIDVLLLAREHGPERVRQAVEEALQVRVFGCSRGALSAQRRRRSVR